METVGVRDLKNRLSHFLRRVQEGERLLVTDHGRIVAELRQADPRVKAQLPLLAELARAGAVRLPEDEGDPLADFPRRALKLPAGTATLLIDEGRGES